MTSVTHGTSNPGSPAVASPATRLRHDIALVPLRMFLGATYAFAGLQKLASTTYFDPHAPAGVAAQMRSATSNSPIGGLLGSVSHHAALFGLLIAFGELAVGIGTLLGLWTRAAAVGGMALALSFLLAVSWHSNPYYLGPDIVFLAAFTPFALAPPSRWSVDAAVARRLRLDRPPPGGVPDARRRRFLETLAVAGWVAAMGLAAGGTAAALGRILGADAASDAGAGGSASGAIVLKPPKSNASAPPPGGNGAAGSATTASTTDPATPTTGPAPTTVPATTTTTPAGTAIGRAADVPVGGSAQFPDPATGAPSIVVQPRAGVFQACSAVCTHRGCTVAYTGSVLHCPCHGAEFDPRTGAVLRGPADQPLATLTIRSAADGTLYVGA